MRGWTHIRCFHYVLIKNSLRSWKFAQLHCERLSAAGCVNRVRWLTARTWEIPVYWSRVSTVRWKNISRRQQQCIPNRWKREWTSKHSSLLTGSREKWSSRVACSIVFAQREGDFLFPAYSIFKFVYSPRSLHDVSLHFVLSWKAKASIESRFMQKKMANLW